MTGNVGWGTFRNRYKGKLSNNQITSLRGIHTTMRSMNRTKLVFNRVAYRKIIDVEKNLQIKF